MESDKDKQQLFKVIVQYEPSFSLKQVLQLIKKVQEKVTTALSWKIMLRLVDEFLQKNNTIYYEVFEDTFTVHKFCYYQSLF